MTFFANLPNVCLASKKNKKRHTDFSMCLIVFYHNGLMISPHLFSFGSSAGALAEATIFLLHHRCFFAAHFWVVLVCAVAPLGLVSDSAVLPVGVVAALVFLFLRVVVARLAFDSVVVLAGAVLRVDAVALLGLVFGSVVVLVGAVPHVDAALVAGAALADVVALLELVFDSVAVALVVVDALPRVADFVAQERQQESRKDCSLWGFGCVVAAARLVLPEGFWVCRSRSESSDYAVRRQLVWA